MVNSVKTYTWNLHEKLRSSFDESYAIQVGYTLTFLGLFEKELGKGNKMISSQVQGQFNFKEAANYQQLIDSLEVFIVNNPFFEWLQDSFSYLARIGNEELFISLRDLICKSSFEESPVEVFKQYLEIMASRERHKIIGLTSSSLSSLSRELLSKSTFTTLYDPTIGTGALVYEVSKDHSNLEIFGQEFNHETLNQCRMLFTLTGRIQNLIDLREGNVIIDPKHSDDGRIQTFDCVVCQPPFGVRDWGYEQVIEDPRFHRGIPPRSQGDFAFITQVIESLNDQGKALMLLLSGVLFREGREGEIRKQLIEENLIETIISLPGNMLYGTAIPINIVIFNKKKETNDVFFINASSFVERSRTLSTLTPKSIDQIGKIYHKREEYAQISKLVSLKEIKENRYNLMIERYLKPQLTVETFNRDSLKEEYQILIKRLTVIQSELESLLSKK